MTESTQEWTKQNLWKTALKTFEGICSAEADSTYFLTILIKYSQGRSYRVAKGAKAAFQILRKCCVFIVAVSN